MRTVFVLAAVLAASALAAQDRDSLARQSKSPATVVDYFIFCPYLAYLPESEDGHWLRLSENPSELPADGYLSKQLLLQGVPLDIRHPPTNLIVDPKNGYVHLTLEKDDVTLVYYERADKSRIVAVRLEDRSGQFWSARWQFYDVKGSEWASIDRDDILPPAWLSSYLPKTLTALDRDGLLLTDFDIDLPRIGTTAHLIPQRLDSDLDSRSTPLAIPGTKRTMSQGTYWDWFARVFGDRTLELKWNKPASRFDIGKAVAWQAPVITNQTPRSLYDLYHHPRNVWESFLAAPDLVADGESGLYWDPNRSVVDEELRDPENDAEFPYEGKQEILAWGAWGEMRPRTETIVDLPGRYLKIDVAQQYWDSDADQVVEGESFVLTLASFETAANETLVAYRFWGRTRPEQGDGPKTEHNQIAAVFFTYSPSGDPMGLNEDEVLPLKAIGSLALSGASKKEQALQAQVIWDVVLPRGGGPLLLKPWRLAYGADETLAAAFDAFVKRWYSDQAVALDWNPKSERFERPRMVRLP